MPSPPARRPRGAWRMNRLAGQTSPYLLQHASNPVDWHAWGPEALAIARNRDKPIFLSVGYSACHWCHVMAHESFEDGGIAALLNESFVCIKVDREERPDIDDIYQRACMEATGQGGWPLSVFLTPDQRPFYVGTYFPPLDTAGRPGFGSLVRQLAQAWREQRGAVDAGVERFMRRMGERAPAAGGPVDGAIGRAAGALMAAADATNGGFGPAPKFPSAACLMFLLCHSREEGGRQSGAHALRTLKMMSAGGMYDHVGGGFHRYSTDARWLVPHFEKMAYDNALVPMVYAAAHALTGEAAYLRPATRTMDFAVRELGGADGGFSSALDADSGGEEGAYYVWTAREVRDALGDDAAMFCLYYDVTDGGNWEGRTILRNSVPLSAVAHRFGVDEAGARARLDAGLDALLAVRGRREAPGLDDKRIAAWNAMMACALHAVGAAARRPEYAAAAERCLEHVGGALCARGEAGALLRSRRGGTAGTVPGYLEDYAWYADALADSFCAGGNPARLERAEAVAGTMLERFYDGEGGFYMTGEKHERLIERPRSVHDLSVPAGASVATRALWRIGHIAGRKEMVGAARRAMAAREAAAAQNPLAAGAMLCAVYARERGPVEVTLLDGGQGGLRGALESRFAPEAITVRVDGAARLASLQRREFFAGKRIVDGAQVAYVCRGSTCSAPLRTASELDAAMSP